MARKSIRDQDRVHLGIRVDAKLLEDLDRQALFVDLNRSDVVRRAIRQYLYPPGRDCGISQVGPPEQNRRTLGGVEAVESVDILWHSFWRLMRDFFRHQGVDHSNEHPLALAQPPIIQLAGDFQNGHFIGKCLCPICSKVSATDHVKLWVPRLDMPSQVLLRFWKMINAQVLPAQDSLGFELDASTRESLQERIAHYQNGANGSS